MKTLINKYIVKYSKYIVTGHLTGIMLDSQLTFPTLELACEFVGFCHGHATIPVVGFGGANYTCHLSRIETTEG